jgi:hypothetical protein
MSHDLDPAANGLALASPTARRARPLAGSGVSTIVRPVKCC